MSNFPRSPRRTLPADEKEIILKSVTNDLIRYFRSKGISNYSATPVDIDWAQAPIQQQSNKVLLLGNKTGTAADAIDPGGRLVLQGAIYPRSIPNSTRYTHHEHYWTTLAPQRYNASPIDAFTVNTNQTSQAVDANFYHWIALWFHAFAKIGEWTTDNLVLFIFLLIIIVFLCCVPGIFGQYVTNLLYRRYKVQKLQRLINEEEALYNEVSSGSRAGTYRPRRTISSDHTRSIKTHPSQNISGLVKRRRSDENAPPAKNDQLKRLPERREGTPVRRNVDKEAYTKAYIAVGIMTPEPLPKSENARNGVANTNLQRKMRRKGNRNCRRISNGDSSDSTKDVKKHAPLKQTKSLPVSTKELLVKKEPIKEQSSLNEINYRFYNMQKPKPLTKSNSSASSSSNLGHNGLGKMVVVKLNDGRKTPTTIRRDILNQLIAGHPDYDSNIPPLGMIPYAQNDMLRIARQNQPLFSLSPKTTTTDCSGSDQHSATRQPTNEPSPVIVSPESQRSSQWTGSGQNDPETSPPRRRCSFSELESSAETKLRRRNKKQHRRLAYDDSFLAYDARRRFRKHQRSPFQREGLERKMSRSLADLDDPFVGYSIARELNSTTEVSEADNDSGAHSLNRFGGSGSSSMKVNSFKGYLQSSDLMKPRSEHDLMIYQNLASIMNKQRDLCEASTLERRRRAFRGQHSLIDPMYTPLEQYVSAI